MNETMASNLVSRHSIAERGELCLSPSHLEHLLGQDIMGHPTYIGRTLQKIVKLFNEYHIEFTIAGALSLGMRGRSRYTHDIDILVHPDDYTLLENVCKQGDFRIVLHDEYMLTVKDIETDVNIDLLFSPFDPEKSARVTATDEEMFGIHVPVIESEYLLWMYLLSTQEKHKVDGISLIQSGNVDLEKLTQYLHYDHDEDCLKTLHHWIAKAEQEQQIGYSQMVSQRKSSKKQSDEGKKNLKTNHISNHLTLCNDEHCAEGEGVFKKRY